ncbi:MAG: DegT/DnrJ/EryC1/StrS family aminotransferase, partial [candidate division WOR-3 bacterium]
RLIAQLQSEGIGAGIHYPLPVHLQPAYRHRFPASLPETEAAAAEIVSLPMYPELGEKAVLEVCGAIRRFFH